MEIFLNNPELDVVGSNISEFMDFKENSFSKRILPEYDKEIKEFAKRRNPINHPSVMFKKESVLKSGNYRKYNLCEDYDLWTRMMIENCNFYNIQEILLNMRTPLNLYERRGGYKYLKDISRSVIGYLNLY